MNRLKTSKIGSILNWIETNMVKKDNTIYTFSIKLSFSCIGQDNSKLQKQISKLLILTELAA